ncbi:MAG: hypothetical protein KF777_22030 [Planctomycetaceae bacterium]|nr:hypothetical protein [Planctomycetaceae bacterium]
MTHRPILLIDRRPMWCFFASLTAARHSRQAVTRSSPITAYTIAIAEELSSQFSRFVTLNPHQLTGHVANLGFWSDEVAHCLNVIDQYTTRFARMAEAQRQYVTHHRTLEFELDDKWGETAKAPPRPRHVSDQERSSTRFRLCDSYYRFLVRCYSVTFIDEARLRKECERHSIGVDARDLMRK